MGRKTPQTRCQRDKHVLADARISRLATSEAVNQVSLKILGY